MKKLKKRGISSMKKRNLWKKRIALALSIVVLASFLNVTVQANEINSDSYSFNSDTGELFIKNDSGTTAWRDDANIPKEAVKSVEFKRSDTPVLDIGAHAFDGCTNLSGTVKLNAQTASIGVDAFKGCNNVDVILIPKTVQGNIEAAGIPENTAYVVYEMDSNTLDFIVQDIKYGSQEQIVFDGVINNGTWSCSCCSIVAKDIFKIVPSNTGNSGKAWYYREAENGEIVITKYSPKGYEGNGGDCIVLPKTLAGYTINEFSDTAFSDARLDASHVFITDDSTKVTLPDNVSKIIVTEKNGKKEAYFSPGNVGTVDTRNIRVSGDVKTLYAKDTILDNTPMLMNCTTVSYKEDGNGNTIITDVILAMRGEDEFTVPTSIEGSPVTTVIINKNNYYSDKIVVDESVNKIICEYNNYSGSTDAPIIKSVTQGSGQDRVEVPKTIADRTIAPVTEDVFDDSVKCVVTSEDTEVNVPSSVGKITYKEEANGTITITEVIPGTDENGEKISVSIPKTIGGIETVMSDEAKGDMQDIPHTHDYINGVCTECGAKSQTPDPTPTPDPIPEPEPTPTPEPTPEPTPTPGPIPDESKTDKDIIINDTNPSDNAFSTALSETPSELRDKVLTDEERARVAAGESASVYLEVIDISEKVSNTDKTLVESAKGASTIGMYIDISLYAKVGTSEPRKVTNTSGTVTITVQVPEALINTDSKVSRTYQIVRVHDGIPSVITCTYDETAKTISFETDAFSTYALAYNDTINTVGNDDTDNDKNNDTSDNAGNNTDSNTTNTTNSSVGNETSNTNSTANATPPSTESKDASPKTGDNTPIGWLFAIVLVSASGMIVIGKKRKYIYKASTMYKNCNR